MDVRLTTLGNPRVLLGEEEIASLPGKPVTFGLLVFLALEREASRDRLVSVFWPESTQEKARHALSQTLYELRQSLGEDWVETTGTTVRAHETVTVDSQDFLGKTEAGLHSEAVELYGGPFLDGVHLAQTNSFEIWVDQHRARFARRYRAAADGFIEECRARGDLDKALKCAWRWVELDPLDDGGQQHLIQLLAESGSRTEALSQFDRYRALLDSELGLEPLDDTLDLVEAIREGLPGPAKDGALEPETEPTSPSSTWPTPLSTTIRSGVALTQARDREELQTRMESDLSPSLDVLRPIGQGSMADVFLAREPHLKRLVAVKVLSPHLYTDGRARKRFEREAQAAARLNHPHVCTVYRVGSLSDGTPFLVSPFVKGTTLAQRLKAEGRLGAAEVRRVLREVASALSAAHKLGLIHRDVRPDNVLRADETGRHSLCDFGIAGVLETGEEHETKLTKSGEILGHPAYISPEQMDGEPLTDRADIYSLGVLGHQLLTGHTPLPSDNVDRSSRRKRAAVDIGPLGEYLGETDPELVDLIGHCLAVDPAHRPSAADVERKLISQSGSPSLASAGIAKPAKTFFSLLMERRFFQVIGGYVAGGFLFLEAVDQLEGRNYLPEPAYPLALTTAFFGFLVANILAWYHGKKGRQEMPPREKWLLGCAAIFWGIACSMVLLG